ncbi:hypothetical protein [Chryseobacterium herbae]|uniref:Uncharacterized protein n=1 Tax=Chryseobacterium herbae TaxID=2976476 RepID=A0ABT2IZB0_9FLAO|nr:hypothetical protein [Chryseobacterium sp. pc1-10]MCT2563960.1 hypothetical protein [Chryseobacterium sp. pc1-10]
MTPRKELFIVIKNKLKEIQQLEYIDLFRDQFRETEDGFPSYWTAVLIRIHKITYETMTEQNQEGTCTLDVILYCKDGWMSQHNNTSDPEEGLMEIDLLDAIAEKLQFLCGEQFKPLQQTDDETEEATMEAIMSYRQSFKTKIYRTLAPKYQSKKISI